MTARTLLNRHGRACHGHPRREAAKTDPWMRGSSPRKTTFAGNLIGADSYAVHPKLNRTAVGLTRQSMDPRVKPAGDERIGRFCRLELCFNPSAGRC